LAEAVVNTSAFPEFGCVDLAVGAALEADDASNGNSSGNGDGSGLRDSDYISLTVEEYYSKIATGFGDGDVGGSGESGSRPVISAPLSNGSAVPHPANLGSGTPRRQRVPPSRTAKALPGGRFSGVRLPQEKSGSRVSLV
jgi:hypothetical protein